jgi:hypothetical protein
MLTTRPPKPLSMTLNAGVKEAEAENRSLNLLLILSVTFLVDNGPHASCPQ